MASASRILSQWCDTADHSERPLLAVDSTGRRNSVVKALGRGRVSQSLSGALVQLPSDYIQLILRVKRDRRPPLRLISRLTVDGARSRRSAICRIDWPTASAREISSRSTSVSDNLERRRAAGRMPPVSARIRWIEEWFRSKQLRDLLERITCLPAIPHQRLPAFGVVDPRSLLHLQHPPAYAGFSVLRSPIESTAESCRPASDRFGQAAVRFSLQKELH